MYRGPGSAVTAAAADGSGKASGEFEFLMFPIWCKF